MHDFLNLSGFREEKDFVSSYSEKIHDTHKEML